MTENYPQLKSDALFRDLMAQLEGTENRITVARNRYIKAVQDYNVGIRTFPNNLTAMVFGYKEKANFTVDNEKEISTAPKVDFNPAPAPASTTGESSFWTRTGHGLATMNAARASLLALLLCWAFAAWADVAVPPLDGAGGRSDRHAVSAGDIAALTQTLKDLEAQEGQPGRGADRADHRSLKPSSNIRSGSRRPGRSGARRSTTARCSSSPRTTASCASRSATVSKAR